MIHAPKRKGNCGGERAGVEGFKHKPAGNSFGRLASRHGAAAFPSALAASIVSYPTKSSNGMKTASAESAA